MKTVGVSLVRIGTDVFVWFTQVGTDNSQHGLMIVKLGSGKIGLCASQAFSTWDRFIPMKEKPNSPLLQSIVRRSR